MIRKIPRLASGDYDLVIVGGGVFGICAAWDASLRGLSVALIESGDFAHATSANCFKIVHGGVRYLQHGDLIRVRESSRERNALLRLAPHVVQPLPIVVPAYGHLFKGKEILAAGLWLYDFLTLDRNKGVKDPKRRISRSHFISRAETRELFPDLQEQGLTGSAVIYDAQMYSPSRLALAFLKSAVAAGAEVANYVEAIGLLRSKKRVRGVLACDKLTGNRIEIRGKVVLNAAGPWAEHFLKSQGLPVRTSATYSRDAAFVIRRRLSEKYGLAVQATTRDPDAIVSRQRRHLFLVPWRDYTLVGVWHSVHRGKPERVNVTAAELQAFIEEINRAYPPLQLEMDDVLLCNAGLVLFGNNKLGTVNLSYGKRSKIFDHAREDGTEGLVTLIGVRYTTARREAQRTIDLVLQKMGKVAPSATATTPVYGGRFEIFEELARDAMKQYSQSCRRETIDALLRNHGSEYRAVMRYLDENPEWSESIGAAATMKAEIVHAVREEMAQKLGDVVLRRTDLGTGEYPGQIALRTCAELMAGELGWNQSRIQAELAEVKRAYPSF